MNISIILYIITALIGKGFGWLIANYQQAKNKSEQLEKREKIIAELSAAKQQIEINKNLRKKCELLEDELENLRNINSSLKADLREVTTKLESTQIYTKDKIHQMMDTEKRLNDHFENLANRIFEQNNRKIDEQNRQNLNSLLAPFREQLDNFRRQIQDNFSQETRERHTLTHEIRSLQKLNAKMAQEAINLAGALKGNNKTQGSWGEIILTHVLEASGLRKGHEYETQVSFETDTGSRVQPDVVVHLPQGRDVIIDAKMTLVAYERYFNGENKRTREFALQEHITSIRNHIRLLSQKNYQQLSGLRTLDYVLMFISVEPAFLLAIDKQPELITEASQNSIMLVSPTTLLVALRTIANLWSYEHQSHNAQKIAKCANKLYDKMRLFIDDMSSIGQSLDRAQDNYHQAMKKLIFGRGNLLSQAEAFRSFGVEVKRGINSELVKQALSHDEKQELNDDSKSIFYT